MTNFEIDFLDHVAINVADMEVSIAWYEKVLGLKKYKLKKWGEFPVFMLSKKTGVALFPAKIKGSANDENSDGVRIDHFAFNVSNENFAKARKRYEELKLTYRFKDHHYFHSIYTEDPDGHTVELTTLMVDEDLFY